MREEEGRGGGFFCKNGRGYIGLGTAADRRKYFIKGAQGWGEYPTPRAHITIQFVEVASRMKIRFIHPPTRAPGLSGS